MITSANFQQTLMQKLLGRNYKWWYIFLFNFKRNTHYRFDVFAFRVGDFLQILAVILVWQLQPISRTTLEWKLLITYFIIGNMVESFTKCYYDSLIAKKIQNGTFVNNLLNPQPILKELTISGMGTFVFPNFASILMVSIFLVFYKDYLIGFQGDILLFVIFILSLLLGWLIRSFFMMQMAFLAFWTTETSGINATAKNGAIILAGSILPFSYLPTYFQWLQYNPFAWFFYHPMQIYLGKYDTAQTIWVFLGGIAWCVALYFLAKLVFKLGLKRNESVGL